MAEEKKTGFFNFLKRHKVAALGISALIASAIGGPFGLAMVGIFGAGMGALVGHRRAAAKNKNCLRGAIVGGLIGLGAGLIASLGGWIPVALGCGIGGVAAVRYKKLEQTVISEAGVSGSPPPNRPKTQSPLLPPLPQPQQQQQQQR